MTGSPWILRLLDTRWWRPVFMLTVVSLAVLFIQPEEQDAEMQLNTLDAQEARLAAEVKALKQAPALPPVHIAWQALSDYLARFDVSLSDANDEQHRALWPNSPAPYWRGSAVGAITDVANAVLSLSDTWNRYEPVALHVRGSTATVLIAVYGTGEPSP